MLQVTSLHVFIYASDYRLIELLAPGHDCNEYARDDFAAISLRKRR